MQTLSDSPKNKKSCDILRHRIHDLYDLGYNVSSFLFTNSWIGKWIKKVQVLGTQAYHTQEASIFPQNATKIYMPLCSRWNVCSLPATRSTMLNSQWNVINAILLCSISNDNVFSTNRYYKLRRSQKGSGRLCKIPSHFKLTIHLFPRNVLGFFSTLTLNKEFWISFNY